MRNWKSFFWVEGNDAVNGVPAPLMVASAMTAGAVMFGAFGFGLYKLVS